MQPIGIVYTYRLIATCLACETDTQFMLTVCLRCGCAVNEYDCVLPRYDVK